MTAIQNFAVGKQTLGQFLVPNAAPYPVNPYYARFDASSGTVSSSSDDWFWWNIFHGMAWSV